MKIPESLYPEANGMLKALCPKVYAALMERKLRHPCYGLKLLELHQWCLWHQPKTVVELGSGLSTIVFRDCSKHYDGIVYTIDVPQWMVEGEATVDWRPIESEVIYRDGRAWYEYSETLSFDCDLLYVDGPANQVDGKTYKSADVIHWMGKAKNLLFDMRHDALSLFQAEGGQDQYDVRFSPQVSRTNKLPWWWFAIGGGVLHHSWARLR